MLQLFFRENKQSISAVAKETDPSRCIIISQSSFYHWHLDKKKQTCAVVASSSVHSCKEIFFQTGHGGKHASLPRYNIPVHLLYEKLPREQHDVMLPVYCLSDCDTVSSFHGHGKATAGLGTKI